jgi:hypothetical protein
MFRRRRPCLGGYHSRRVSGVGVVDFPSSVVLTPTSGGFSLRVIGSHQRP